jgi:hypothetical protein
MNVQPIEHGADTAAQPQSTKVAITAAQKKQPPQGRCGADRERKNKQAQVAQKAAGSSEGFR